MLSAELHCHTIYSKDSLTRVENLLTYCRQKGIQRIAITDHNTTRGACLARSLDPTRVVVGEEIMTQKGELLAFYVEEELPAGLTPQEAIRRLRQQGAVISISHPFDHARHGAWLLADLLEIVPLVDAIETFNARCLSHTPNQEAQAFAAQHHLPGTPGSDAHLLSEVGRANLRLPEFNTAEELRQALRQALPQGRLSSPWVHISSTFARLYKRLNIARAPK
jgi:predicted metal-dependent phosphoesterase TrpH